MELYSVNHVIRVGRETKDLRWICTSEKKATEQFSYQISQMTDTSTYVALHLCKVIDDMVYDDKLIDICYR